MTTQDQIAELHTRAKSVADTLSEKTGNVWRYENPSRDGDATWSICYVRTDTARVRLRIDGKRVEVAGAAEWRASGGSWCAPHGHKSPHATCAEDRGVAGIVSAILKILPAVVADCAAASAQTAQNNAYAEQRANGEAKLLRGVAGMQRGHNGALYWYAPKDTDCSAYTHGPVTVYEDTCNIDLRSVPHDKALAIFALLTSEATGT